jgi:hypothetical protein
MPIIKIAAATRTSMAEAIIADLDAGEGPATVEFYTGDMPAGPATAVTDQVKLGTLTCADPCATATNGVITFAPIAQDDAADASGNATWARFRDSTGAAVLDVDVTDEAGTGTIKLNTTTIVAGGPIRLNSQTLTLGGA